MNIDFLRDQIQTLSALDLSTYPSDNIRELMKNFGRVIIIEYKLHPGKKVLRARCEDQGWPYLTRASLSYKPQQFNTTHQRASTPERTMFYGSVIPDEIDDGDLDNERIVVSMEASPWLRSAKTCGVKRIAYSRWEVTEDIKMVAVIHNRDFYAASSHTRKLVKDFLEFAKKNPEYREPSILVSDYLAREFGKEESTPDYHYLISALYTEFITDKGLDGVLYPSVRVEGKGFNIAITPEAADSKLRLVAAGECTMYKRLYGDCEVDNDTEAVIIDEYKPFYYKNVKAKYHSGEDYCLKQLGVSTREELCTNPGYLNPE
jgi:hypothetical protein